MEKNLVEPEGKKMLKVNFDDRYRIVSKHFYKGGLQSV